MLDKELSPQEASALVASANNQVQAIEDLSLNFDTSKVSPRSSLGKMLSEVDNTSGNAELNGLADTHHKNAKQLYEVSARMQAAGNAMFANTYREMADNYMAAGDYARSSASNFYTYNEPMWKNTTTPTTAFGIGWNTGEYSAGFSGASVPASWQLVAGKETPRVSVRAGAGLLGAAFDYDLEKNMPTFFGYQQGSPSIKIMNTYSIGYVSDAWAPMAKFGYSAGYFGGAELSLSIGLNGVKGSASLGGGYFGKVTGKFPQQEINFGGGPSWSIGWGKQ